MRKGLTARTNLSQSSEDYLREMWSIEEGGERITRRALAGRLNVSPPSVTQKVHQLALLGLVSSVPHGPTCLTEAGRRSAADVTTRYDLARMFLKTVLGYSAEIVDAEADRLEHALSPRLQSRIVSLIESPNQVVEAAGVTRVTPAWLSSESRRTGDLHTDPE